MATTELITMSTSEIDRVDVVRRVKERRLTCAIIGVSERQMQRLCAAYEAY